MIFRNYETQQELELANRSRAGWLKHDYIEMSQYCAMSDDAVNCLNLLPLCAVLGSLRLGGEQNSNRLTAETRSTPRMRRGYYRLGAGLISATRINNHLRFANKFRGPFLWRSITLAVARSIKDLCNGAV